MSTYHFSSLSPHVFDVINLSNILFRDILQVDIDKKTAEYILALIREEEKRSDEIKQQSRSVVEIAAADAIDLNGVAAEQSFNREQVQEQEQEQVFILSYVLCHFNVFI
jgi:hypothetical protein